jgi:hypothetical protein
MLRKVPLELLAALVLNLLLFLLFLGMRQETPVVNPPVEITVDISNFELPKPDIMPPREEEVKAVENEGQGEGSGGGSGGGTGDGGIAQLSALPSRQEAFRGAMQQVAPSAVNMGTIAGQTVTERGQELARITQGIRTFDGINSVKSGLPSAGMPAGLQRVSSFKERGNEGVRKKLLKQHGGGNDTETAVLKALRFLAKAQNDNGSWGSEESFKTGDAAALTSLALLTFFAHGENFQSRDFGETIHKGADFLIELSNIPDIEYAGSGFGHAILTYALAEGYAISGSMSLRNALEKRLKSILSRQNKFGSFSPNYDNSPQALLTAEQKENPLAKETIVGEPVCDLSLLGWHIQAMAAAKNSGLELDSFDKALGLAAESLVKIHQAQKGGFSQGINMRRFPDSEEMNAVGLLGLQLLGSGKSNPAKRVEKILQDGPDPQWKNSAGFPLYRWYYQTQALFHAERGRGKTWEAWNQNLKRELLGTQQSDGSWNLPGGDTSFRVKNRTDLSIYGTSLCGLMLQVYYRYLPSYNITETMRYAPKADEYDLGGGDLIAHLPGGADPMAAVILGIGATDMEPLTVGVFNGKPATSKAEWVQEEFGVFASMRSTIAVKEISKWPQTLQPNQRLALFFDDLLPRNFKGHVKISLGLAGEREDLTDYKLSLEAVINGKRLYNSLIHREKQLVELVIPSDVMQPYNNIFQIRNNGKATLAFDAVKISAISKVGKPLYLLAENLQELPAELQSYFSAETPAEAETVVSALSGYLENKQLLAETDAYEESKLYLGEWSGSGTEYMGNEFQLHYLRQTGREITDWLSGGGSGVRYKGLMSGGRFFDSVFGTEYPAVAALRQAAKLFEGKPHQLPVQIYPTYGEKALLYCSAAAAYNAPGVATIVISKRFPIPEETELVSIIPWNGATEVTVEKGFLAENSPFRGMAAPITSSSKTITVENHIFRYSDTFPELTVIRLVRQDSSPPRVYRKNTPIAVNVKFDYSVSGNRISPDEQKTLKAHRLREARGFAAVFGVNGKFSTIPATKGDPGPGRLQPVEKESMVITFTANAHMPGRYDSVYLPLGNAKAGAPKYLSFFVYPRATGLKRNDHTSAVPMRFALGDQRLARSLNLDQWQQVIIPLNDLNPYWQHIRVVEPDNLLNKNIATISYEINDISVWCTP